MNNKDIVFNHLIDVPEMNVAVHGLSDNNYFNKENYSAIFGVNGGGDVSPEISWNGVPEGTKSFVVTMYDPDAPTQSGFWHWSIKDIPASVTKLTQNAGSLNSELLPKGSVAMPMDARMNQYVGAAPAEGDTAHPYHIVVTALDVEVLDVSPDSTPAFMNFNMIGHELARGSKIVYAKL